MAKPQENHNGAEGKHAPGPETTIIPPNATADDLPPISGDDDPRQQLSRLSLGLIGCDGARSAIAAKTPGAQSKIAQALIYGAILGLTGPKELPNAKTVEEKYTYGLVGDIEAVNLITGEMFKSGICYLPGGFHDIFLTELEAQLGPPDAAGNRPGKGGVEIQFALEFSSIAAGNKSGYSWVAANKMPAATRDRLANVRKRALKDVRIGGRELLAHLPQTIEHETNPAG